MNKTEREKQIAVLRFRAWLAQANPRLLARLLREIHELEKAGRTQ